MSYKRILNLKELVIRKSVFLFGPRQTGKSTWLRKTYPEALYINLLSKKVFDDYYTKSNALESDIEIFQRKNKSSIVIVDEIQKIPFLLDEVHNQIELNKKLRFILTGSSARKLKRSGINLLGGRASWCEMHPLTYPEMKEELKNINDLERRLLLGGLPGILLSTQPQDDFDDYIQLYLNEEIKAEGQVRNYESFNKFLLTAATSNAKQLNFTEIGSDTQIPPRTVYDYYQILEDTLIGFKLEPFKKTITRKAVATAKFYLFDTGLVNALLRRKSLSLGTNEFGDIFEQYVILEVKAYNSYKRKKSNLYYWRTHSQYEVDLIVEGEDKIFCIEVKSKSKISTKDKKGILAFSEEFPKAKKIIVIPDGRHSIDEDKIEIIPVFDFFKMLWDEEFF